MLGDLGGLKPEKKTILMTKKKAEDCTLKRWFEITSNTIYAMQCLCNLECPKWGFKRWGLKRIWGHLRKKAFFLRYPLDFPEVLFGPSGKGRKSQKNGEKSRFRPISRNGDQTPLKPPFVTPPFATAPVINLRWIRKQFMSCNLGPDSNMALRMLASEINLLGAPSPRSSWEDMEC